MQIKYDLPLPEVLREDEEWLCLSQNSFMWRDDDFVCPFANPTYSSKHTPKGEEAINQKARPSCDVADNGKGSHQPSLSVLSSLTESYHEGTNEEAVTEAGH